MGLLHGRQLIIAGDDGMAIAASKSCSIQTKSEQIEISSPNSSQWREFIAGRKEWTLSTNHFVQTPAADLLSVGKTVALSFKVVTDDREILPFHGIKETATIRDQSTTMDSFAIVWVNSRMRFAAIPEDALDDDSPTGYASWRNAAGRYINMESWSYLYHLVGKQRFFEYDGDDLLEFYFSVLTGQAICTACRIDAMVGNMAQGSFSFQGTGPLSEV